MSKVTFPVPSRRVAWLNALVITGLLALLAVSDLVRLAERLGVDLGASLNWTAMLGALGMLGILAIVGALFSLSPPGERLVRIAPAGWAGRIPPTAGLALFAVALVAYSLFTFSPLGGMLGSAPWARLLVFWFIALVGAAGLSIGYRLVPFALALLITTLLQGVIHRIAMELPNITDYPFSLGWSETTRFYLASLFRTNEIYGRNLGWPIINPSLHILLVPPYWIETPLWFHRFWQIGVRYLLLGLTAWALVKRLSLPTRTTMLIVWAWAFLYLFQGPLYFQLSLAALLVLWGYRTGQPVRTWIVILLASAWSGLSRINWFPVPASIAAMLYLLEVPYERGRFWKYVSVPALWIGAGTGAAFIAQRIYIALSGVPDPSVFFTSLESDILWYRLLPNPTYALGVLPGILLVSLPLFIVIVLVLRRQPGDWHPVRLAFMFLGLLGYFLGGLIVSAKIGGGGDLHNMDTYMILLMIVASYLSFGRYRPQHTPQAVPIAMPWFVLLLLVLIPVWFAGQVSAQFASYDRAAAAEALVDLQTRVDQANAQDRDLLFISQRHLISMNMLRGAELVPAYEREELMEMAMSNQQPYLDAFRADIENQRFELIVVDPLKFRLLGSNYSMGEENNVWVRRVIRPILCNYDLDRSYPQFNLAFYVPQEGERKCP